MMFIAMRILPIKILSPSPTDDISTYNLYCEHRADILNKLLSKVGFLLFRNRLPIGITSKNVR